MRARRAVCLPFACFGLLLPCLAVRTAHAEWALPEFQYRRVVTIRSLPPGASVCHVAFAHLGVLAADGRDIRVTDSTGKVLNHELLRLGPGDRAEILFECSGAKADSAYSLYFGNNRAAPPKRWTAQAGVVLEIRKRAPGGCGNWAEFDRLFSASKQVEGRTLRSRIFDGQNPVGPNEDFVSYYRACFNAPTAGAYLFATNSDDASFLNVDGTRVAQYPGWHGAWEGRFGQHSGTITLTAGVHKLEYYHVQGGNESVTVAAWQPPGAKHLVLIPEQAFVPVARAHAGAAEPVSGKSQLDFAWSPLEHLCIEKKYLVRYLFESEAAYSGALVWDFGDGTTASVQKTARERLAVRHLYLHPGTFTVTLSAKDGSGFATLKQTVAAEPVWTQREDFDESRWKEWREPAVARVEQGKVSGAEMAGLIVFARETQDAKLMEFCAAQAWKLSKEMTPDDRAQAFLTLGMQLQALVKDFSQASRALQEAARSGGGKAVCAQAQLHRAGLLIHYFGREQEAWDLLQATPDADLSSEENALKQIYLADACAGLGQREEAVRRYEALRRVVPLTDRHYAAGRRGRLLNIRFYIKTAGYETALQELQKIEWETPQERMAGDTGMLRAECYLAQGNCQHACVLLNRLLKVNPASPKVPEMRLMLIKVCQAMNRKDLAAETYARLKKESPYAAETALAAGLMAK